MKQKKATIYESLQGLIIFAILLVSVILFSRSFAGERTVNQGNSLNELNDLIKEILETDGATRRTTIELDQESAIIAYSKDSQAIYTKINQDGSIFPDQIDSFNYLRVSPDIRFKGFIKTRADSCPTNAACICYCEGIDTKTINEHNAIDWRNAYLVCERERCRTYNEDIIPQTTNLGIFFEEINKEIMTYLNDKNSNLIIFPEHNKMSWEGGFIIMRTVQQIGKDCYTRPSLKSRAAFVDNNCPDSSLIFETYPNYIIYQYELVYSDSIAGYRRAFPLRHIDVEFTNDQGKIKAKLI